MKVVIMAGGKGTRISSLTDNIPKPMLKIEDKPVLEYEIECLSKQGFTDIIITVSYLAEVIINYFGDGSGISPVTGKPFGVNVEYFFEKEPLGNAGALFKIKEKFKEDFFLLNADIIFDIDFKRFADFHKKHGGMATLFTHPNNHPYDSELIIPGENNIIEKWISKEDKKPEYYKNCVNAGLHIINPKLLNIKHNTEKIDLDSQILKPLAGTGKMFFYNSSEYVKDMGTPERFYSVCEDFKAGKIQDKNLKRKQRAVFLDRDGTINKYAGFIKNPDDVVLIEDTAKAIKKINDLGYLAIVVTNQPVIARGEIDKNQLTIIHNKIETLLGNEGAYLDAIYYCPHHPDKGFNGEIKELKIECNCRKPKPGMLFKAAEDFNINLNESWMVGDNEIDIMAGKASGCKTVLIGTGKFGQDITVKSLYEFMEKYNGRFRKKITETY